MSDYRTNGGLVLHAGDPVAGVRLKSLLRPRILVLISLMLGMQKSECRKWSALAGSGARPHVGVVTNAMVTTGPPTCTKERGMPRRVRAPATFESGLAYEGGWGVGYLIPRRRNSTQ